MKHLGLCIPSTICQIKNGVRAFKTEISLWVLKNRSKAWSIFSNYLGGWPVFPSPDLLFCPQFALLAVFSNGPKNQTVGAGKELERNRVPPFMPSIAMPAAGGGGIRGLGGPGGPWPSSVMLTQE